MSRQLGAERATSLEKNKPSVSELNPNKSSDNLLINVEELLLKVLAMLKVGTLGGIAS